MKAAVLTATRTMEIRDVPAPKLEHAEDVLLRVETVGVCGSDMHYYRDGRIGAQVVEFPWIVGHECAATVLKVGQAVKTLRPGDRVAVDPLLWCTTCDQCRAGRINTCRKQKFLGCPGQAAGAMTEQIIMPARSCVPIPDAMTFEQAVLTEPFAIGLHAVKLAAARGRLGKAAILGTGPIGLCVLAAMKHLAPDCPAYVTELLSERRALADRMGADWTGDGKNGEGAAEIARREPLGVDAVFECAGKQETIDEGGVLLTPGGVMAVAGIPVDSRVSFDMNFYRRKELCIQNVRRQNECVQEAIDLVARGEVDLDPLVTHRFTLDQSQEAYDLVADYRDGIVKAMIRVAAES
ncbi:MAG TPA: hypothetical protein DCX07_15080 [Phycisphaerales bacterium]|nr:hypothetical protein [Phycisphaerales bacterium]